VGLPDAVEDGDGGAGLRQRRGVLAAQTAVAAGDDGDVVVESKQMIGGRQTFGLSITDPSARNRSDR